MAPAPTRRCRAGSSCRAATTSDETLRWLRTQYDFSRKKKWRPSAYEQQSTCMVKRGEIGDLGGLWREGLGLSERSETRVLS